MREKFQSMREKMIELEKNSIDIGRDPAGAMAKISTPLLDQLRETVESDNQPTLVENMFKKGKLELEESVLNQLIYD